WHQATGYGVASLRRLSFSKLSNPLETVGFFISEMDLQPCNVEPEAVQVIGIRKCAKSLIQAAQNGLAHRLHQYRPEYAK
ncbi:MAG: hypothetical protein WBV82_12095, partial [Myxococcaceae bacterium]